MVRIGVISENNKNDGKAIADWFRKNFPNQFDFYALLQNIHGGSLDDKNSNHLVLKLRREFELETLDYVLYIRDLDALISDKTKLKFRKNRFRRFSKVVDKKAIFMLNIVEIEALILADFDTFKQHNNQSDLHFENIQAAEIENPSDYLEKNTSYQKSDLSTIIPLLNLETLKANHKHFKTFLTEFFKMIEQRKYKDAPYYN